MSLEEIFAKAFGCLAKQPELFSQVWLIHLMKYKGRLTLVDPQKLQI